VRKAWPVDWLKVA